MKVNKKGIKQINHEKDASHTHLIYQCLPQMLVFGAFKPWSFFNLFILCFVFLFYY